MKNVLLGLFLAATLGACSTAKKVGENTPQSFHVETYKKFGRLQEVKKFGNWYVSGRPNKTAFKKFKEQGVVAVIDLRQPKEVYSKSRVNRYMKEFGFNYYNVPVSKGDVPNEMAYNEVSKLLMKYEGQPVLIHCASGQRAAAWLAMHLEHKYKWPHESAMGVAQQAGLTNPKMVKKFNQRYPASK